MESLHDDFSGTWAVTTETSVYLIDLDRRRLKRIPGAGLGSHSSTDRVVLFLSALTGEGEWVQLLELVDCHLGAPCWRSLSHERTAPPSFANRPT